MGRLTSVNVFLPAGEMVLLGRVSWARLVGNRTVGNNESRPVYRVGIAFSEGQTFAAWDRLVSKLLTPAADGGTSEPKRRVIRWRGR